MNPQHGQRYHRVERNFPGEVQEVLVTALDVEEWDDNGTLTSDWRVRFVDEKLGMSFGMPLWQFRRYFRLAV